LAEGLAGGAAACALALDRVLDVLEGGTAERRGELTAGSAAFCDTGVAAILGATPAFPGPSDRRLSLARDGLGTGCP
jgi:hypothetical protein